MTAQKVNEKEIAGILEGAPKVALFGHILPDGDCFGSIFALKLGLERIGKEVFSYLADDLPDDLSFLKEFDHFSSEKELKPVEVAVVLDSSDLKRTENHEILQRYKKSGVKVLIVDHHTEGDFRNFADFSWIDSKKSSTCEMVLSIFKAMGLEVKKDTATMLLTGIEMDTSSFQNQNTTAEVLEAAAYLMSKGARMGRIIKNTFQAKDMQTIKIYGLVLERLIYNKKYGAIVGYITQKDIGELGLDGDVSTGIANYLNTIEDAKIIIFITEMEGGTLKVSLRTRDDRVDVSRLAKAVGGGGHIRASGFMLKGSVKDTDGSIKITC